MPPNARYADKCDLGLAEWAEEDLDEDEEEWDPEPEGARYASEVDLINDEGDLSPKGWARIDASTTYVIVDSRGPFSSRGGVDSHETEDGVTERTGRISDRPPAPIETALENLELVVDPLDDSENSLPPGARFASEGDCLRARDAFMSSDSSSTLPPPELALQTGDLASLGFSSTTDSFCSADSE
jgi:hypothetical protein